MLPLPIPPAAARLHHKALHDKISTNLQTGHYCIDGVFLPWGAFRLPRLSFYCCVDLFSTSLSQDPVPAGV